MTVMIQLALTKMGQGQRIDHGGKAGAESKKLGAGSSKFAIGRAPQ